MRRRRRSDQQAAVAVPVILPQLVVQPSGSHADGFTITFNGQPVTGESVPRAELGRVVAAAAERAGTAVRVEVHDADGGVYADIVHPPLPDPGELEPSVHRDSQACATVRHSGFLPGEGVLIAGVHRIEHANHDGVLELRTDHEQTHAVVLVGSVSGTTIVNPLA